MMGRRLRQPASRGHRSIRLGPSLRPSASTRRPPTSTSSSSSVQAWSDCKLLADHTAADSSAS